MLAKAILANQISKISKFLYLLLFLFIVNIIFNLNYNWQGISIILKVYMFIFSFYLIFNFSQLRITPLKKEFEKSYGKWGIYVLFLVVRVVPYVIIYFVSGIFTYIQYLGTEGWPWSPTFDLLYGKNTNHIFMSVLLLIVLKIKKDPKITVPIFLIVIAVHFVFYKSFYKLISTGLILTWVKVIEFVLLIFFITYEFFFYEKKFIKSAITSLVLGVFVYWSLIGTHYTIYKLTDETSYCKYRASRTLLKMGYSFPLKAYKNLVFEEQYSSKVIEFIHYSRMYHKNINLSDEQWEALLNSTDTPGIDSISYYMIKNKIYLDHKKIIKLIRIKSETWGINIVRAQNLIKYLSLYYEDNRQDFLEGFDKENQSYKIWVIRVISNSGSIDAVPFLIDLLTGIDVRLSKESYNALVNITSLNPLKEKNVQRNSPYVVARFKMYYLDNKKKGNK